MAMYAMAAAQLLFDEDDHFWQLFSSGDFLQSKRMHPAPADDAQLVEVPVIHWGLLSPVMSMLRNEEDPFAAIEQIRALRLRQKWQLAEAFIQQELTPAQRAVVACLVTDGLSDQQIAERLVLSPRTIERHLGDAYSRATQFFGFSERVTRAQLIALLQIYYSMQLGETPHDN
jgi:DNA-binding CsgD family transcriptional regulator